MKRSILPPQIFKTGQITPQFFKTSQITSQRFFRRWFCYITAGIATLTMKRSILPPQFFKTGQITPRRVSNGDFATVEPVLLQ
jgi:hypothetical protein